MGEGEGRRAAQAHLLGESKSSKHKQCVATSRARRENRQSTKTA